MLTETIEGVKVKIKKEALPEEFVCSGDGCDFPIQ